jgi:hypothetical protein
VVALSPISDGETFPGQIITAQHHQDMQPLAEFAIPGKSSYCFNAPDSTERGDGAPIKIPCDSPYVLDLRRPRLGQEVELSLD